MKVWLILTLLLGVTVECIKGAKCAQKPKCTKLNGKCQLKGENCNGAIYSGKKFCKNDKTCQCCVKKEDINCGQKGKCNKVKGSCQLKEKSCGGVAFKGSKYCKSNLCQCCIDDVEKVCPQKAKCKAKGGVCQINGEKCEGKKLSGKKLCASKSCQCCIEDDKPVDDNCYPITGLCKGEEEYCEELKVPCKEGWEGTPNECAKTDNSKCQCCKPAKTGTGQVYLVDGENGSDLFNGLDENNAFKTIQHCVSKLMVSTFGSECRIRSGRYHEVLNINGLRGTRENPYKIGGYRSELPVWDGTVAIQPTSWDYDDQSGICSAKVNEDIFALFLDDDLLTAARWPNALWSDKTIFNNTYWGHCDESSSYGTIVDNTSPGLAASGINATGTMAILNIGSWETFVRPVTSHVPGSSTFTYDHDMGQVQWKGDHNQYYLEAGLELLDAPGEWFYDFNTKLLYLIPPSGGCPDPKSTSLRGRTIDYGLTITNTTGLTLTNMIFFASNIHAHTIYWKDSHINNITLDSLQFKFPSSSHRMLGSTEYPLETKVMAKAKMNGGIWVYGKVSVVNCIFEGAEGSALVYDGKENFIHNNKFIYNDWSCQTNSSGGGGTVIDKGIENEFSHNSLINNGISAGLRGGLGSIIKYNDIYGQCAGMIMNDGAGIQVSQKLQNGTKIFNNWVHDSAPKHGIRFDTPEPTRGILGYKGYMGYNVVWNVISINVKGDEHFVENNLAMDRGDKRTRCILCVWYRLWRDPVIQNNQTIVINNAASQADGGNDVYNGGMYPIAGAKVEDNYSGHDIKTHLVDPDNRDFRPIDGGPLTQSTQIIGPYAPGLQSNIYWIPGYRSYKASSPIPSSGAIVPVSRDVVMFLEGYLAEKHDFYFGDNKEKVMKATKSDKEFQKTYDVSEGNFLQLPSLVENTQYYWRVDAIRNGKTYQGNIWELKASS